MWHLLKPLTFTRPACELRVGIVSIREKWEHFLNCKGSWFTKTYLSEKYPTQWESLNLLINGAALPNAALVEQILNLKINQVLTHEGRIVAALTSEENWKSIRCATHNEQSNAIEASAEVKWIAYPHHIFTQNFDEIENDFAWITANRQSAALPKSVSIIGNLINEDGSPRIFVEEGANVEHAIINVKGGSVYIGKDATIMEGSLIRGPFALCEHSTINMGAKIYGGTTLGPWCKAGGELNNVVFQAYSNKGHDGFLGNSVLGEWCNLGADTNNSNLKNNYSEVKIWSYKERRFVPTGLQFCGLIMGDHTKTGINTMFNTGTVVGVFSNIFGPGFPRTFIPSFVQGGALGYKTIILKQAFETAHLVMMRRNIKFTDEDKNILTHIFEENETLRKLE